MDDLQSATDTLTGHSSDTFGNIGKQIMSGYEETAKSVRGREAQATNVQKDIDATLKAGYAESATARAQYAKTLEKLQADTPPQANIRSPLEAFGSFAGALASLSGLITRHPLVTSLKAATAAIQGAREGDYDQYKINYQNWKTSFDHAMLLSRLQSDQIRMIMDDTKLSVDEQLARINTLYAANRDEIGLQTARANGLLGVGHLELDRQKMAESSKLHATDLEEQNEKIKQLHSLTGGDDYKNAPPEKKAEMVGRIVNPEKWAQVDVLKQKMEDAKLSTPEKTAFANFMTQNPEATPQQQAEFIRELKRRDSVSMGAEKAKAVEELVATGVSREEAIHRIENLHSGSPEAIEATAKMIAEGKMAPLSSFALGKDWGLKVMARVMELNPNYTGTEYTRNVTTARAFATGRQGDSVRFMNVSIAHLNTLGDLADALKTGNVQRINAVGQRVSAEFGGAAPTNFDAAKQIIAQEITKAIIGAGAGTGDERRQAAENLNRAYSPDQLKGVIETTEKLLAGQLGGLRRQYEQTTHFTNFDDFLSPEAKRILGDMSGQSDTKAVGTRNNPSKPTTQKEYDALPPGSYFEDDEGVKVKP